MLFGSFWGILLTEHIRDPKKVNSDTFWSDFWAPHCQGPKKGYFEPSGDTFGPQTVESSGNGFLQAFGVTIGLPTTGSQILGFAMVTLHFLASELLAAVLLPVADYRCQVWRLMLSNRCPPSI